MLKTITHYATKYIDKEVYYFAAICLILGIIEPTADFLASLL